MPHRATAPLGAPCWIDLSTSDVDRSIAFYEGLLGWTAGDAVEEFGGYRTFTLGTDAIAGAMPAMEGVPDTWSIYFAVADIDATVATALAAGATEIAPVGEVGDLGRLAFVADPSGAVVGFWEPGAHPGFTRINETGAPTWFELQTKDYDAAKAFYGTVFSWPFEVVSDTPEFRYCTNGPTDDATSGMIDASAWLTDDVPSHWTVYLGVDDAEAANAKAVELGATILQGPDDSPYGILTVLADPNGAIFRLHQPGGAA